MQCEVVDIILLNEGYAAKMPGQSATTLFYNVQPEYTRTLRAPGSHTFKHCTEFVFYCPENA